MRECLARIESDGAQGIEALCAEHPRYAAQLRERLGYLTATGLVRFGEREAGPFLSGWVTFDS